MKEPERRGETSFLQKEVLGTEALIAGLTIFVLVGTLWASALAWPWGVAAQEIEPQASRLSELPVTFPIQSPEVAAFFQEIARADDSASFPPDRQFLLPGDSPGLKIVAFRSWREAQTQLDSLSGPVDMVMYNPENWDLTPEEEKQELVSTVREFATFVQERGLRFMFAPDRRYAELYLGDVVSDVDAVMLQAQRLQHDPQTFGVWVQGMAEVAHTANPDVQVFVQVGATRGTAQEMLAALRTVAADIDGIAVWSMPRTLHVLQEFVSLLRDSPPASTVTATSTLTVVPTALPATETLTPAGEGGTAEPSAAQPEATQVATTVQPTESGGTVVAESSPAPAVLPSGTPAPQKEQGSQEMGWVTDLLLFAGGAGLGLVMGFALGWSLRRGQ
jgi:hypothetical protein